MSLIEEVVLDSKKRHSLYLVHHFLSEAEVQTFDEYKVGYSFHHMSEFYDSSEVKKPLWKTLILDFY